MEHAEIARPARLTTAGRGGQQQHPAAPRGRQRRAAGEGSSGAARLYGRGYMASVELAEARAGGCVLLLIGLFGLAEGDGVSGDLLARGGREPRVIRLRLSFGSGSSRGGGRLAT